MEAISQRVTVFRDKDKLLPKHIPDIILHREHHMHMLQALFEDFLKRPGRTYQRVIQILGPIGTGKTCTAYRFGLQYQRDARSRDIPLHYIHVNCKLEAKTLFDLYQGLLKKVASGITTRGQSTGETLGTLVRCLRESGQYLLLALDDVDYLIRRTKTEEPEGGVVYDLTRLNEMHLGEYQNVVGVLFIARDHGFRDLLDPSERSSLGNVVIRLPSYDSDQLRDILLDRIEEAFVYGTVEDEIVEYVADLTAGNRYNPGDCRFALDILLTAGLIADAQGANSISVEHVRRAIAETFWGISSEDLMALEGHNMAVLTSAVEALQTLKTPYVSMKSVHEFYQVHCEEHHTQPLSYSRVKEIIGDLDTMGALDYRKDKGVSIAGASLEDLSRVLKTLKRRKEYYAKR